MMDRRILLCIVSYVSCLVVEYRGTTTLTTFTKDMSTTSTTFHEIDVHDRDDKYDFHDAWITMTAAALDLDSELNNCNV